MNVHIFKSISMAISKSYVKHLDPILRVCHIYISNRQRTGPAGLDISTGAHMNTITFEPPDPLKPYRLTIHWQNLYNPRPNSASIWQLCAFPHECPPISESAFGQHLGRTCWAKNNMDAKNALKILGLWDKPMYTYMCVCTLISAGLIRGATRLRGICLQLQSSSSSSPAICICYFASLVSASSCLQVSKLCWK